MLGVEECPRHKDGMEHCFCMKTRPAKCCGCWKDKHQIAKSPTKKTAEEIRKKWAETPLPGLDCVHNNHGQGCGLVTPWEPPKSEPKDIPSRVPGRV